MACFLHLIAFRTLCDPRQWGRVAFSVGFVEALAGHVTDAMSCQLD